MTVYCAIPPLDQAATRIGRGYGLGYNRARTRMDQMHAGFDLVADAGTPVVAPIPGTVATKSDDTGPGYQRRFRGYGNSLVLEHRFSVPGIPNPFYTLYAHLQRPVTLEVGQRVSTGDLLGYVGQTTNGQFAGMGPHLHTEVRRAPVVSYGSRRDTFDPAILWDGLGFAWIDNHREAERLVGGQLLLREGPLGLPRRAEPDDRWLEVGARLRPAGSHRSCDPPQRLHALRLVEVEPEHQPPEPHAARLRGREQQRRGRGAGWFDLGAGGAGRGGGGPSVDDAEE
ncbi:MAG: M23 family metallopeptidase [Acidobacteria bacterium]|nr:M23 family metallopeptidase [Acidobacteriota bacterium]